MNPPLTQVERWLCMNTLTLTPKHQKPPKQSSIHVEGVHLTQSRSQLMKKLLGYTSPLF
jgi:hypothetical protein